MSVLMPFDQCIARPNENGKKHFIKEHLLNVKKIMENWLETDDIILTKLMGLSGICHDIAKANTDWQKYIKNDPKHNRGPTHAPSGALLFSFLAYNFLKTLNRWKNYRIYWIWMIRDIADHHGSLKRLNNNHWIRVGDWDKMDIGGIQNFIHEQYPELQYVDVSEESLYDWLDEIDDILEEAIDDLDLGYDEHSSLKLMQSLQFWRHLTSGLIAGDRFDVKSTMTTWFDEKKHANSDKHIDQYCLSKADHPLFSVRMSAQQEIISQLANTPNERFYTLEMPTGYGKTITALKLACWLGLNKGYSKIIYVAPYLSILEQTSVVIEKAMKIGVLEHHSLAILEDECKESGVKEQRVPKHSLAMESWAHSIVCTSFQQWSRALFPKNAQNVLRRSFLCDSVIIIDEPQIFNPEGWNVFLCGLEALVEQYNLRVIFLSATMPTFKYGLSKEPVKLSIRAAANCERYKIVNCINMNEDELAQFLIKQGKGTQAAILNTIEDAFRVYNKFDKESNDVRLLHGLMIPLHKKLEIIKIQEELKLKELRKKPFYVISTQILEAGVDVSFEYVVRTLSILTSIIQAAGRVNRHSELEQGILFVVPFYRGGEKDTRKSVYTNKNLCDLTDKLLRTKDVWLESETLTLIQEYYKEMFKQNTYEAGKEAIRNAYEGNWTDLAKFEPFGVDYLKLPLFVPWNPIEEDMMWLPKEFVHLQKMVGIYNPEELYERYRDRKFMNNLSFEEHKRFNILFHHYVLNIPVKVALKVASKEDYLQNKIPILFDNCVYNQTTGLTSHFIEGYDSLI